jgi:peptidoglycan/LPS O-acetylase OafA/YrhL
MSSGGVGVAPGDAVSTAGGGAGEPARPRFRGDVDGLRAVAILLVVAFHVGLPGFSGGFVGVDVFFVISGYLITRNLVAESDRRGRPDLLRFWARRIRRLVPALALMLVVVLGLAMVVLPFVEWPTIASQARAAALYVSNIAFARQATNYFAPDINTSLFLHTWSLGVEEQFYLLWPLLVTAVCWRSTRGRGARPRLLAAVFTATLIASFALCLAQTSSGSPYAFFGLPARAWEFAAAGLLALAPAPSWLARRGIAAAVAIAGLVCIAIATVSYTQSSPYPGARAVLPVVGAVLVIVAGMHAGAEAAAPSRLLAIPPMQWLGRVSYSWYLWHWPLILLAVAQFQSDRIATRAAAAVVALGVAAAAHRFVENPLRFSPRFVPSPRLTYALGAVITVLVLMTTVGVNHATVAAASDGTNVSLTAVRASKTVFTCAKETSTTGGIDYCEDGDLASHTSVLLEGDSHARHWVPAFAKAAKALGVKLVVRWHSICPAIPVSMLSLQGTPSHDCDRFHADTASLIRQLRPTAVVVSQSDYIWDLLVLPRKESEADRARTWGERYRDYLESLRTAGIRIGAVVDTPRMQQDAVTCLAEHTHDAAACATPVAQALGPQAPMAAAGAQARREVGHVPTLDINGTLCRSGQCQAVANGTYVYVDFDHLYRGFVLTEVPAVETFLRDLLR